MINYSLQVPLAFASFFLQSCFSSFCCSPTYFATSSAKCEPKKNLINKKKKKTKSKKQKAKKKLVKGLRMYGLRGRERGRERGGRGPYDSS